MADPNALARLIPLANRGPSPQATHRKIAVDNSHQPETKRLGWAQADQQPSSGDGYRPRATSRWPRAPGGREANMGHQTWEPPVPEPAPDPEPREPEPTPDDD